jgi:hypothetical protein
MLFFTSAITSISHSVGSKAGGLTLTIYGNHFDERAPYSKLRAYVGGKTPLFLLLIK